MNNRQFIESIARAIHEGGISQLQGQRSLYVGKTTTAGKVPDVKLQDGPVLKEVPSSVGRSSQQFNLGSPTLVAMIAGRPDMALNLAISPYVMGEDFEEIDE